MNCRFCKSTVSEVFADLVNSPPSNSYLNLHQLNEPETFYPLKVMVCQNCFLVQIDEYFKSTEIFDKNYAYFSSYSTSWLAHSKRYCEMMIERFKFNSQSLIIEVASNDGYLLKNFKEKEIPVLGIEPTANTAEKAKQDHNIDSIIDFFGIRLAKKLVSEGKKADLLLGNNVLAHVPDIMDFVGGLKLLLNDQGIITLEFPHLYQLVSNTQFDTIYHEHFSYLSFNVVKKIFEANQLEIFDVEELTTHGGSLRIFAKHSDNSKIKIEPAVNYLLQKEKEAGMLQLEFYKGFQTKIVDIKNNLVSFLIKQKQSGKTIAAYGAAAKGNTLLNYCGIKKDIISFVVDSNPVKQNKYMPASHIPIVSEEKITETKPDFILILPWNLKDEIEKQLHYVREWDCKFIVPIPDLKVF